MSERWQWLKGVQAWALRKRDVDGRQALDGAAMIRRANRPLGAEQVDDTFPVKAANGSSRGSVPDGFPRPLGGPI